MRAPLGRRRHGKTRLAAELLAQPGGDPLVLSARAYPFGQTASFGLWSEAFERHLRRLSVNEVVELCGGFLDDMAGLARSVAAARGAAPEGEAPLLRLTGPCTSTSSPTPSGRSPSTVT